MWAHITSSSSFSSPPFSSNPSYSPTTSRRNSVDETTIHILVDSAIVGDGGGGGGRGGSAPAAGFAAFASAASGAEAGRTTIITADKAAGTAAAAALASQTLEPSHPHVLQDKVIEVLYEISRRKIKVPLLISKIEAFIQALRLGRDREAGLLQVQKDSLLKKVQTLPSCTTGVPTEEIAVIKQICLSILHTTLSMDTQEKISYFQGQYNDAKRFVVYCGGVDPIGAPPLAYRQRNEEILLINAWLDKLRELYSGNLLDLPLRKEDGTTFESLRDRLLGDAGSVGPLAWKVFRHVIQLSSVCRSLSYRDFILSDLFSSKFAFKVRMFDANANSTLNYSSFCEECDQPEVLTELSQSSKSYSVLYRCLMEYSIDFGRTIEPSHFTEMTDWKRKRLDMRIYAKACETLARGEQGRPNFLMQKIDEVILGALPREILGLIAGAQGYDVSGSSEAIDAECKRLREGAPDEDKPFDLLETARGNAIVGGAAAAAAATTALG